MHLHCVLRREKHVVALLYLIGVLEEQNYPRKRVWLVANLLEYQMSFAHCVLANAMLKSGMRPNKDCYVVTIHRRDVMMDDTNGC